MCQITSSCVVIHFSRVAPSAQERATHAGTRPIVSGSSRSGRISSQTNHHYRRVGVVVPADFRLPSRADDFIRNVLDAHQFATERVKAVHFSVESKLRLPHYYSTTACVPLPAVLRRRHLASQELPLTSTLRRQLNPHKMGVHVASACNWAMVAEAEPPAGFQRQSPG